MARDRDVAAFGERAQRYDEGWLGQLHHQIADRTADLALTCVPAPTRILDVGCGTGYLLGRLAARAPQAEALAGIDAAPAMIRVARDAATDDRLRFAVGTAERLPWPAATFDQHDLVRSLGGPAGRSSSVRPGAGTGWRHRPSRPVLGAAAADPVGRAAGQGAHKTTGNPAGDGSRIAFAELAPPLRHHHPGSYRYQIATAHP
jgi:SAM-dependent methyltransferase